MLEYHIAVNKFFEHLYMLIEGKNNLNINVDLLF